MIHGYIYNMNEINNPILQILNTKLCPRIITCVSLIGYWDIHLTFYIPHLNDVVKKKNRIILDMARSMLKAKGIPNNFWVEAVSCLVYLLNRSSTKNLQNVTPEEAWNGFK